MDKKEELIRNLACFGCSYCNDCNDDFDEDAPVCNLMYIKAKFFVLSNIDNK